MNQIVLLMKALIAKLRKKCGADNYMPTQHHIAQIQEKCDKCVEAHLSR